MQRRWIVVAALLAAPASWAAAPTQAAAYAVRTTDSGIPVRWSARTIPLRIDPSCSGAAELREVREALVMATEAWRGLPGVPDLVVADGAPGPLGVRADMVASNGIYVAHEWPYEPGRLAVTLATYSASTGAMVDADIVINGHELFALLDEGEDEHTNRYDLASVLTHELGHVLGLEESDVKQATMWPKIGKDQTFQRTLETDDEEGIIAVYHGAILTGSADAGGCGGANVAGGFEDHGAPLLTMVGVALLMLLLRRRRWA